MKLLSSWNVSLTMLCALTCNAVQAGWPELHHEMHVDKLRNNAWPTPFRGQDAAAVVAPLEIQKNNGWRLFNTIGSSFFDEKNQLTDAGMHKIGVSLYQTPSNRRTLFVLKGADASITAARVEAVQIAVSQMVPVGTLPAILVTDQDANRSSGELQTQLVRGMRDATPIPRIPKFSGLNTPSQQTNMQSTR